MLLIVRSFSILEIFYFLLNIALLILSAVFSIARPPVVPAFATVSPAVTIGSFTNLPRALPVSSRA